MNKLTIKWLPGPYYPRVGQWYADAIIDGESCHLDLTDHVAPSGNHYRSVTARGSPYQGSGNQLHVEINGVELRLGWNGSNRPKFPRRPTHCNYQRHRLSPEQIARLKGEKPRPALAPLPEPEPNTGPDPDRIIEADFRQSWIWWKGSIRRGPPWVTKLAMKGNGQVRLRGDKDAITKDCIWINGERLRFLDSGKPFCVCRIDGRLARRIRGER